MRTSKSTPITIIVHDGDGKLVTKLHDTTIHEVAELIDLAVKAATESETPCEWVATPGTARGPAKRDHSQIEAFQESERPE